MRSEFKVLDPNLAKKISQQIKYTENLLLSMPRPIDSKILATPKGSEGRKIMEKAVNSLQEQAKLFIEAGTALGVKVKIMSE